MAKGRYSGKKRETELGEVQGAAIMALHILSVQCEQCLKVPPCGVGDIYIPGRAISEIMGGTWNWYRHGQLMKLAIPGGWIKAKKGFEKGSSKAELWRYALTEQGRVHLIDLALKVQKDCVYQEAEQEHLFSESGMAS